MLRHTFLQAMGSLLPALFLKSTPSQAAAAPIEFRPVGPIRIDVPAGGPMRYYIAGTEIKAGEPVFYDPSTGHVHASGAFVGIATQPAARAEKVCCLISNVNIPAPRALQ